MYSDHWLSRGDNMTKFLFHDMRNFYFTNNNIDHNIVIDLISVMKNTKKANYKQ